MVYAKRHVPKGEDGPLNEPNYHGVFLGYGHDNSTFLVGRWETHGRVRGGVRFVVEENATVSKWFENTLIKNVDDLKESFITIPIQKWLDHQDSVGAADGDPKSDLVDLRTGPRHDRAG